MSLQKSLSRIDLNLLVALQILLEERSVTRAAERLFITQPAMSKTLSRLRDLFEDPLFTRASKGLIPTPLAEQLQQELPSLLGNIESLVFREAFDPASAEDNIKLSVPVVASAAFVPFLLEHFMDNAPGLKLTASNVVPNHLVLLRTGELDFSIYYHYEVGEEFTSFELSGNLPIISLMREGHPLANEESVTPEQLAQYRFIALKLPDIDDPGVIELNNRMDDLGVRENVLLETNNLFTSLEILVHSNIMMLVPDIFSYCALSQGQLVSVPVDRSSVEDGEAYTGPKLHLIQHNRTLNSPLHTWVRETILSLSQQGEALSKEEFVAYLNRIWDED